MALYRFDVQMRFPWPDNPSGYYYGSNTYYAQVVSYTDYDYALDYLFDASWRGHHVDVLPDWCRVTDLDTGTVIRNASWSWTGVTRLSGEYPGLLNTVYISLLAGGVQVGYKRLRTPLRCVDIDGERLTQDAIEYFRLNYADILVEAGLFCNIQGVLFDDYRVSPIISGWQLRHGTKRRAVRRYHI